jgi:hypothetical protein
LEGVSKEVVREIAQGALELCGFEHRFSADEFSAVVWDGELEVKEFIPCHFCRCSGDRRQTW